MGKRTRCFFAAAYRSQAPKAESDVAARTNITMSQWEMAIHTPAPDAVHFFAAKGCCRDRGTRKSCLGDRYRGPCACPTGDCASPPGRGQAQGPFIRPTAPLVPTHTIAFPFAKKGNACTDTFTCYKGYCGPTLCKILTRLRNNIQTFSGGVCISVGGRNKLHHTINIDSYR